MIVILLGFVISLWAFLTLGVIISCFADTSRLDQTIAAGLVWPFIFALHFRRAIISVPACIAAMVKKARQ